MSTRISYAYFTDIPSFEADYSHLRDHYVILNLAATIYHFIPTTEVNRLISSRQVPSDTENWLTVKVQSSGYDVAPEIMMRISELDVQTIAGLGVNAPNHTMFSCFDVELVPSQIVLTPPGRSNRECWLTTAPLATVVPPTIAEGSPNDGDILIWNDTTQQYESGPPGNISLALNELSDVTVTSPLDAQVLTYVAGEWVNLAPSAGALNDLSDVTVSAPALDQVLTYNGAGQWVNQANPADATTASNLGGGSGLYAQEVANDLQFKSLTAGSTKIALSPSATEVAVDVNEANLSIAATQLTGQVIVANGGTGVATLGDGNVVVGAGVAGVTSAKAAPAGDFVGTSDAQTLSNKTITSAANTLVIPLNDLSDTLIVTPLADQVLSYSGAAWVNAPPTVPVNAQDQGYTEIIEQYQPTSYLNQWTGTQPSIASTGLIAGGDKMTLSAGNSTTGTSNGFPNTLINPPTGGWDRFDLENNVTLGSASFVMTISNVDAIDPAGTVMAVQQSTAGTEAPNTSADSCHLIVQPAANPDRLRFFHNGLLWSDEAADPISLPLNSPDRSTLILVTQSSAPWLRLYVDGLETTPSINNLGAWNTSTDSKSIVLNENLAALGQKGDSIWYDFQVYDRSLTPDEVASITNNLQSYFMATPQLIPTEGDLILADGTGGIKNADPILNSLKDCTIAGLEENQVIKWKTGQGFKNELPLLSDNSDVILTSIQTSDLVRFNGSSQLINYQSNGGQVKLNNGNGIQPTFIALGTVFQEVTYASALGVSGFPTSSPPLNVNGGVFIDAHLYDFAAGVGVGKFQENAQLGQINHWRFIINWSNKAVNNSGNIVVRLRNPLSGFVASAVFALPQGATSGDEFYSEIISIADGASLQAPLGTGNGYICEINSTTSVDVVITSIARINQEYVPRS